MTAAASKEWYADGLHFECTQCGNCCTGSPGYVWFHLDELKAMAKFLKMVPQEFLQRYARLENGYYTLNENLTEHGHDCVFLRWDEKGKALCSIYEVRPTQCRTWPFWPENLRSRRSWDAAGKRCPGIARGGPDGEGTFVPIDEIRIRRDATPH